MFLTINPEVAHFAALFTDGEITDEVLADVAAMRHLPLHVAAPRPAPPCAIERAYAALAACTLGAESAALDYVSARRRLGYLSRAPYADRADGMRCLNRARRAVRAAERGLAEARVALDAALIAAELREAA